MFWLHKYLLSQLLHNLGGREGNICWDFSKMLHLLKRREGKRSWIPYVWSPEVVLVVENLPANAGDVKRHGFDHWVGKIPWRRA